MSSRRAAAPVAAVLTAGLAVAAPANAGVAVVTVTQAGDSSFRVPGGVTSVAVRATGAAGQAGGVVGGGGGGSNFSSGATEVTVDTSTGTPHVQLTYTDEQSPTVTVAPRAGATISGFAGTDSGDAGSVTLEFYEG